MIKRFTKLAPNILGNKRLYIILNKMIQSDENKRIAKGTEHSITTGSQKIGGGFVKSTKAAFLESRVKIWDDFYQKQEEYLKSLPREKIVITLKDGKQIDGTSFQTTPLEIAKKCIKKSLVEEFLVAKVYFYAKFRLNTLKK